MRKMRLLFGLLLALFVSCGTSAQRSPDVWQKDVSGDLADVTQSKEGTAIDEGLSDAQTDGTGTVEQDEGIRDIPKDESANGDGECPPYPNFSENCAEVEEFQSGFEGGCVDGELWAYWHHHWLCHGKEEIEYFSCTYKCPYGCKEPTSYFWPHDGKEMVAYYCAECEFPSDCEGREHPACVGEWKCKGGVCIWECSEGCIGEGGYVPVVPDAPECCEGLIKVSCDAPDEDGKCQLCAGASICTKCYDGICGIGENKCNCPEDCRTCFDVGEGFIGFDTEGKCCEGLVAKSDCDLTYDGCSCPKCPCYLCLPCGDGVCGPFEHRCNCPEDCPEDYKCVQTYRSQCEGDPYGTDKKGELKLEVRGHDIFFRHEKVALNCCLETTVCFAPYRDSLEIVEQKGGDAPCFCECLFTIEAMIEGIKSGDYNYAVYNEEHGATLFEGTLTVP